MVELIVRSIPSSLFLARVTSFSISSYSMFLFRNSSSSLTRVS